MVPKGLVTADEAASLAAAAAAAAAAASARRQRLVRAAGNRRADWAAVTRVEYVDAAAEEEELWEEDLVVAADGAGCLASEGERADDDGGTRHAQEGEWLPLTRADDVGWPDLATQEMLLEHDDLWNLDAIQREQLAWLWLHKKFEALYAQLAALCEQYERLCRDKAQLEKRVHLTALRTARVVGMTASALAKHAALVAALAVEVLVVVEAAELLEAPTLVAFTPAIRQVLLFGDRQQIRPHTAVKRLAQQFRMAVTLFERLLQARIEHAHMPVQHRMAPALSPLLSHFYPTMRDHPHVLAYPRVAGIERPIFLIKHAKPEATEPTSRSRCHPHEAKFAAQLAAYLLRQGYMPSQLTILAPYCGQLIVVRRELQLLSTPSAAKVRTSTIDAFRGEQSDVVILSLVRSHAAAEGTAWDVGMLASETRVTMALSRARIGLYVIGNAEALASRSKVWEEVARAFKANEAIGNFLPLLATRTETGKRALVRSADDFDGVVGEAEASRLHDGRAHRGPPEVT